MPAPGSAALGVDEPRSASTIVGEAVTGHHVLHIDGYSRTKDKLPTGKSIKSRPFSAGGRLWRILYFPNGQTSKCADFISIFLHLDGNAGEPVMARAKFDLLDRAGKPVPSHAHTTDLREFPHTIAEQHNCPGLKEACIEFLISPDALEAVMVTDSFEHLTKSFPALVKELMSKLGAHLYKRRKL